MSRESDVDELKKRAAAIIDEAARHERVLSNEEDAQVLKLLEQAHSLEHELKQKRKASPVGSPAKP